MADYDSVYKALRLVPDFDGNPSVLPRFIKICDQLVEEFEDKPLVLVALLNGILNKVTGPAARLINTSGAPDDWLGIRGALVNNFADHRDEVALYNDLANLSQGSSTPQEYYEQCQNLFSTMMTYVSLHETVSTTITSKRTLYKKLTLQAFLRGLKEPLGSRIRCMRPETIEKALEFVHEESNILYLQKRNELIPDRKTNSQSHNNQPFKPPFNNFASPKHSDFYMNMPGPSRANFNAPHNFGQMPKPIYNQNFQNRGPTRTQQMFAAPLPNYTPRGNAFNLPQRNFTSNNNAPRPMSGVSHFTPRFLPPTGTQGHNWATHGNPPPNNYFKSRQMNYTECYDPESQYDTYDYCSDIPDYSNYYDTVPDYPYYYANDQQPFYPALCPNDSTTPGTPVEQDLSVQNPPENFQSTPNREKPK